MDVDRNYVDARSYHKSSNATQAATLPKHLSLDHRN
jgi:hypothetical protein